MAIWIYMLVGWMMIICRAENKNAKDSLSSLLSLILRNVQRKRSLCFLKSFEFLLSGFHMMFYRSIELRRKYLLNSENVWTFPISKHMTRSKKVHLPQNMETRARFSSSSLRSRKLKIHFHRISIIFLRKFKRKSFSNICKKFRKSVQKIKKLFLKIISEA